MILGSPAAPTNAVYVNFLLVLSKFLKFVTYSANYFFAVKSTNFTRLILSKAQLSNF